MRTVAIYRHQLFQRSETFIAQQAGALAGFKPVYVGRSRAPGGPERAAVVTLMNAGRTRRWGQALLRDPATLAGGLRPHRPVLIHAHFGVEGVYALRLAKQLGIPLVTTFHGFDATTTLGGLLRSGKVSWINYALFRRQLASHGALFVCVSDYIRQRVLELGFPAARTVTHHIGIDTRTITPLPDRSTAKRILHVARLVEKKGTRYLLDAFARLASSDPEVELTIIGAGPLRADLEQQAQATGFGSRIRFLGAQPHAMVLEHLARANVFCLPSITARSGDAEGLPISILEAAALAVPVVATRHSGIPEAVVDGETGYLVAERDSAALADRIDRLLKDEGLSARLGRSARLNVEQRFDIKRQTLALEALYESVL
jgi:colanic acid/amylovoran biosynthesis glycosyltransferase